jgi:hypothetical protein
MCAEFKLLEVKVPLIFFGVFATQGRTLLHLFARKRSQNISVKLHGLKKQRNKCLSVYRANFTYKNPELIKSHCACVFSLHYSYSVGIREGQDRAVFNFVVNLLLWTSQDVAHESSHQYRGCGLRSRRQPRGRYCFSQEGGEHFSLAAASKNSFRPGA